jgi:DNA-binding CsgD family transcriptional regulator
LTAREREVLHLAAEGRTNTEIATRLGISSRTAETHRSNLMHKLDLHTQADLIRFALRRGIIPMDEQLSPIPKIPKLHKIKASLRRNYVGIRIDSILPDHNLGTT